MDNPTDRQSRLLDLIREALAVKHARAVYAARDPDNGTGAEFRDTSTTPKSIDTTDVQAIRRDAAFEPPTMAAYPLEGYRGPSALEYDATLHGQVYNPWKSIEHPNRYEVLSADAEALKARDEAGGASSAAPRMTSGPSHQTTSGTPSVAGGRSKKSRPSREETAKKSRVRDFKTRLASAIDDSAIMVLASTKHLDALPVTANVSERRLTALSDQRQDLIKRLTNACTTLRALHNEPCADVSLGSALTKCPRKASSTCETPWTTHAEGSHDECLLNEIYRGEAVLSRLHKASIDTALWEHHGRAITHALFGALESMKTWDNAISTLRDQAASGHLSKTAIDELTSAGESLIGANDEIHVAHKSASDASEHLAMASGRCKMGDNESCIGFCDKSTRIFCSTAIGRMRGELDIKAAQAQRLLHLVTQS